MKTTNLTLKTSMLAGALALTFTLGGAPQAQASDKEWATAGKILAGVVAADILFNHLPAAVSPAPTRVVETRVYQEYPTSTVRIVEQPYVYCPPPQQTIVYQSYPPPVVTYVPPPPVVVVRPCPPPVVHSSISIGFGSYHGRPHHDYSYNRHHPWTSTGSRRRTHAW